MQRVSIFLAPLLAPLMALTVAAEPGSVGTFEIDGSSYFQFAGVRFEISEGSVARFRFGELDGDGAFPLSVAPQDFSIETMYFPSDAGMQEFLHAPGSGALKPRGKGWFLEFYALVNTGEEGDGEHYPMTFRSEFIRPLEQSTKQAGLDSNSAPARWQARITGRVSNTTPKNTPIYMVLNGEFDRLPFEKPLPGSNEPKLKRAAN